MWPSQNIWTLNEALLGRESNLSFPNNLAVLFLENWFWVLTFFSLILPIISKWNFQTLFIVSSMLHAPWNISKKWQHSIIWGPNREEQLLHSGVISFLRLRLANQFSCPCFTTFTDIACFQWPTYQDCYFSKNFILLCTTYFTKYYHMPPCHEWVSYS